MELYKASNQWSQRPADERFSTLEDMLTACTAYKNAAAEADVAYGDLNIQAKGKELLLAGKTGLTARFTNWAFGQLCRRTGAPASYLAELPAELAADNLNHSLSKMEEKEKRANVLFHQNGSLVVRSIMSEIYERIWNADIVAQLIPLQANGWRVPPARPAIANQPGTRPATLADLSQMGPAGLAINEGDLIAPAGLYASDRDMFAFMINENARIEDGSELGLARGFFVENNEVGNGSYVISKFLHRGVCGNHIVWGAENVREFRFRHVGETTPARAFKKLEVELIKYANESASDEQAKIASARKFILGDGKESVVEAARKLTALSFKKLDAAYDIAEENETTDGAPVTAYGFSNGLTRLSQTVTNYAGERDAIDRAAGKVLQVAF